MDTKPVPTPSPPAGASLLAMAVGQLARMLDVPTSSRASSLPHWICGRLRFPGDSNLLCGSKACSRWRWVSLQGCGCTGLFASKLAPTVDLRQASISRRPKPPLWEQSLLAMAVGQLARMWMYRPLREQTRSHSGSAAGFDFAATQGSSVGAKLARDGGGSACKDVECTGLFASKLAPTLDLRQASISGDPNLLCGSKACSR